MYRRACLSTGACLVVGLLSGCTRGGGDGGTGPSTDTSETGGRDGETAGQAGVDPAERALAGAVAEAESEPKRLDSLTESTDGQFDTTELRRRLDEGEAALDAAAEAENPDRRRIVALREVIAWGRATADCVDATGDGFADLTAGFDAYQAGEYDSAGERFVAATAAFDDATAALERAESTLEELDREALADVDGVTVERLEATGDLLEVRLRTLGALAAGYREMARGMAAFESALETHQAERWAEAESGFDAAHGHFDAAAERFEAAEPSVPAALSAGYGRLTCPAGAFRDASDHLREAARAAQRGDVERLRARGREGRAALERCD